MTDQQQRDNIPAEVTSYIDGQWLPPGNQTTLPVIHAASEAEVSTLREADAAEVGLAVTAAKAAFEAGAWAGASVAERKRVLLDISRLILCTILGYSAPPSVAALHHPWILYTIPGLCTPSVAAVHLPWLLYTIPGCYTPSLAAIHHPRPLHTIRGCYTPSLSAIHHPWLLYTIPFCYIHHPWLLYNYTSSLSALHT